MTLDIIKYNNMKLENKMLLEATNNLKKEMKKSISHSKISDFIGSSYFRFREKWGYFEESYKKGIVSTETIENLSYLKPHNIMTGEELNNLFNTQLFCSENYILFVEYDMDCWNNTIDEERIYDYLIIEL